MVVGTVHTTPSMQAYICRHTHAHALCKETFGAKMHELAVEDLLKVFVSNEWGLCEYVIVHTILGGSPVILWISLGGKPKWLPLKFGYHDVMHTSPIEFTQAWSPKRAFGD